jgi:hypothetical protein
MSVFSWFVIISKFAIFFNAVVTSGVEGGHAAKQDCFDDVMLYSFIIYHHEHALPTTSEPCRQQLRTKAPHLAV